MIKTKREYRVVLTCTSKGSFAEEDGETFGLKSLTAMFEGAVKALQSHADQYKSYDVELELVNEA